MKELVIECNDLDLEQIAESGQVFRMNRTEENTYRVHFKEYSTKIRQEGYKLYFSCSKEEFENIWYNYFDLGTDYSHIKSLVDKEDTYLMSAVERGYGIRILRQDLWEVIVSFIISQNNNIKRIKNSVEKLCTLTADGSFPSAETLADTDIEVLHSFGLGYRDEYIKKISKRVVAGEFVIEKFLDMSYEESKKTLMAEHGIGKKVADCICVFGLHKLEAFPVDTHIRQILKNHYEDGFPYERYGKYLAVIQQYMFYYDLIKSK